MYDISVIDGPANVNHYSLEIAQNSLLVIQPIDSSLEDLKSAISFFDLLVEKGVDKNKLCFILNRVTDITKFILIKKHIQDKNYIVLNELIEELKIYSLEQEKGFLITELNLKEKAEQARKVISELSNKILNLIKLKKQ